MATNTTLNTAATVTYTNKTYYDPVLLAIAKTKMIYAQFGQKRSIPRNGGKSVEFRKYTLFTPNTETLKLTEGVTPTGQSLGQTKVDATVEQYGSFVEVSDFLDLTAQDPVLDDAVELLGEQVGTTIEWVTRDAMIAGASAQYGGDATSMLTVESTDKLTLTELRRAVATLKKSKARPFNDGGRDYFVCVVDPDSVYDLQSDATWLAAAEYADTTRLLTGEIGQIMGVRFVESTEGYISEQSVLNKVNANTTSSADFVLKNAPTAAEIVYLSTPGNKIKIGANKAGATEYTLHATTPLTVSGDTYTVKLTATPSLTGDHIVFSEDAGFCDATTCAGVPIHHSLICGRDAYGIIDVDGEGTIQTIIKQIGSGGTSDPLDQRGTVAAKVMAYTAKVLNSLWIIDVQTAATLTN